jgi:hypothetical protein
MLAAHVSAGAIAGFDGPGGFQSLHHGSHVANVGFAFAQAVYAATVTSVVSM